jgi:hypothetical protein
MPRLDNCHQHVSNALAKDGWIIARKSVFLTDRYKNDAFIDIDATRPTNGTQSQQIYVEVKCFDFPKDTAEFHRAIGQYIVYRGIMRRAGLPATLFLAVPSRSFDKYFNPFMLEIVAQNGVNLLVVDMETEDVLQWIT